jgi:hypothetical protein
VHADDATTGSADLENRRLLDATDELANRGSSDEAAAEREAAKAVGRVRRIIDHWLVMKQNADPGFYSRGLFQSNFIFSNKWCATTWQLAGSPI